MLVALAQGAPVPRAHPQRQRIPQVSVGKARLRRLLRGKPDHRQNGVAVLEVPTPTLRLRLAAEGARSSALVAEVLVPVPMPRLQVELVEQEAYRRA